MLLATFTDTGYSQPFTALAGGFGVFLTPMTGTNSLTLEREVAKDSWVTWGSAITAAGYTAKTFGVDYHEPIRVRVNCGTHDTVDISVYLEGDILADEFTTVTGAFSLLLESGDDRLLESGEYRELEH